MHRFLRTGSNHLSYRNNIFTLVENKLSGGLPPFNLTNLSNLQRIEHQHNNLTDELPNFLSQISTLQVLNLRNNLFQGSIPKSICNLSNLQILDLSNNLTGEIPKEFGNLVGIINEPPNSPSPIIRRFDDDFSSKVEPRSATLLRAEGVDSELEEIKARYLHQQT